MTIAAFEVMTLWLNRNMCINTTTTTVASIIIVIIIFFAPALYSQGLKISTLLLIFRDTSD